MSRVPCEDPALRVFARCVVLVAMALAFAAFGVGATPRAPLPPNACQGQWTVPSPLQFQTGLQVLHHPLLEAAGDDDSWQGRLPDREQGNGRQRRR